ncbi:MAG: transposase family protein [Pseudonocardia sp.]
MHIHQPNPNPADDDHPRWPTRRWPPTGSSRRPHLTRQHERDSPADGNTEYLRLTFVSEPVPGNQHDMAKLKESECEMILKLAGDVIGDKGFIGTDYIITPVRKPKGRDLYMREHDYNEGYSGRAYGFVSLQVRAVFLKIILPPE